MDIQWENCYVRKKMISNKNNESVNTKILDAVMSISESDGNSNKELKGTTCRDGHKIVDPVRCKYCEHENCETCIKGLSKKGNVCNYCAILEKKYCNNAPDCTDLAVFEINHKHKKKTPYIVRYCAFHLEQRNTQHCTKECKELDYFSVQIPKEEKSEKQVNANAIFKKINIIISSTTTYGIGNKKKIPWPCFSEMEQFERLTCDTEDPEKRNAVIMGRDSMVMAKYPLKARMNVIIIKNCKNPWYDNSTTCYASDVSSAVAFLSKMEDIEKIFVIGGKRIFDYCFEFVPIEKIYWTWISDNYFCEVHVKDPKLTENYQKIHSEANPKVEFCIYVPKK